MKASLITEQDILYFAQMMFILGKISQKEGIFFSVKDIGSNVEKIMRIEKSLTMKEKNHIEQHVKYFTEEIAENFPDCDSESGDDGCPFSCKCSDVEN